MKKLQFSILLLLMNVVTYGQNWKPYKIDDSVQVSLPEGFVRKDTLGQTIITAETSFGNILITKTPDNPKSTPDIEKEKHLKKYYDNFVKDIQKSAKEGIISGEKDTTLEQLRIKEITLAVDSGNGKQFRNIRILHENSATYTFQFLYNDFQESYAAPELTTFFNSLKIPPQAGIESQFTDPENTTGKSPYGNRSLFIIIGVTLLILLGLFLYLRRGRLHH